MIKGNYDFIHAEIMATYNVYVTTSDEKGAGTDGNVYIVIYGENGDTGMLNRILGFWKIYVRLWKNFTLDVSKSKYVRKPIKSIIFMFVFIIAGKQYLTKSKTNKDKFKRGNTDHFVVEAVQLGAITKMK